MDDLDIRRMVRESLERKIREEISSLRTPPRNFEHFTRIFLSSNGLNLDESALTSTPVFEILHETWGEIKGELSLTRTPTERESVWREISKYYIGESSRRIKEIIK